MAGDAPGYVVANALYRVPEVQRRLDMSRHAFRKAARTGLRIHKFGRCHYVLGQDILDWMATQPLTREVTERQRAGPSE